MFLRAPDGRFNLANFMRVQLFSALSTLRIGMDVLQKQEGVRLDQLFAHGGLFKTRGVAQGFLAAAIDTQGSVGEVAAEGGAWGIAVLARSTPSAAQADLNGFPGDGGIGRRRVGDDNARPRRRHSSEAFMQRYVAALPVERAAVRHG